MICFGFLSVSVKREDIGRQISHRFRKEIIWLTPETVLYIIIINVFEKLVLLINQNCTRSDSNYCMEIRTLYLYLKKYIIHTTLYELN